MSFKMGKRLSLALLVMAAAVVPGVAHRDALAQTSESATEAGTPTTSQAVPAAVDTFYAEWRLSGNQIGSGPAFLGTTDNYDLVLRSNNIEVMKYQGHPSSPNVRGGSVSNVIAAPGYVMWGACIAGGGYGSGGENRVTDRYGFVGGGAANMAGDNTGLPENAAFAAVSGGWGNTASGYSASVSGGYTNTASNEYAHVGGGYANVASGGDSAIAGGSGNDATHLYATVVGGHGNAASSQGAFVGGGEFNTANGLWSTVCGGSNNRANATRSAALGGESNHADGENSFVGAGWVNIAAAANSSVAGGTDNEVVIAATDGTIGGGSGNLVGAAESTICGGAANSATGWASFVGGGNQNTASGYGAAIAGGYSNTASGAYSVAAGNHATASHAYSFVWNGSDTGATTSFTDKTFTARAPNGFYLYTRDTGNTTGYYLTYNSGGWQNLSDRDAKENFADINHADLLSRIDRLPVMRWNYKDDPDRVGHIGPMAQDFHAAFGVGPSDKSIGTVDADGVALAAVQGVFRITKEQQTRIQKLELDNQRLGRENAALADRLTLLEARIGGSNSGPARTGSLAWLVGLSAVGFGIVFASRKRNLTAPDTVQKS